MNDHPQIALAKQIAVKYHMGQYRWDKVTPYITHPQAVVEFMDRFGYDGYAEIATAWLHDVLEDTVCSGADLQNYGVEQSIIDSVITLSKNHNDGGYLDYILNILNDPIARIVKYFDIKHNMSCFDKPRGSLYQKYELALHILKDGRDV